MWQRIECCCGNMRYSYGRREHIRNPPHGIAWGKMKYEFFRDIMRCAAYADILFFTRFARIENHECWAAIDTFVSLVVWVKQSGYENECVMISLFGRFEYTWFDIKGTISPLDMQNTLFDLNLHSEAVRNLIELIFKFYFTRRAMGYSNSI